MTDNNSLVKQLDEALYCLSDHTREFVSSDEFQKIDQTLVKLQAVEGISQNLSCLISAVSEAYKLKSEFEFLLVSHARSLDFRISKIDKASPKVEKVLESLLKKSNELLDKILEVNIAKASDLEIKCRDKLIDVLNNYVDKVESITLEFMNL